MSAVERLVARGSDGDTASGRPAVLELVPIGRPQTNVPEVLRELLAAVGKDRVRYELVVNAINKDRIRGYISAPKDTVSSGTLALQD